jgi:quinol monooxygenase YgiN
MTAPLVTEGDSFISRFTLKPERRDEFLAMFGGLVENFRAAMGETTNFVFYGWSRSGEFIAIESWLSPEIVAAVRADPGFVDLVTQLLDCCSKPMQMEVFNAMNSDGSIFTLHPAGKSTVHPDTGVGAVFI